MLLVSHRPGAEGASVQFIDGVNVFEPFPILRSGIKKKPECLPAGKADINITVTLSHVSSIWISAQRCHRNPEGPD